MLQERSVSTVESLESRTLLSMVYPSNGEQYTVEVINRARANPNAEAARYGIALNEGMPAGSISASPKQPLALNPMLVDSARGQSYFCIDKDYLSHYGYNGNFLDSRMRDAGYQWVWYFKGSENISYAPNNPSEKVVADDIYRSLFVDSVVPGRGHRGVEMDGVLKEIGVGMVAGNFQGMNAVVGTWDFAVSSYLKGATFLTGVAFNDTVIRDNFYSPGEGLGGVSITATRSDGAVYRGTTWGAGGYTIALFPGSYTVTATGGGLGSGTAVYRNVGIGSDNVKLDFTPAMAGNDQPPPPPAQQTPFGGTAVTISATGVTTIEAENFDDGGDGVSFHDSDAYNSGGAYRQTGVDLQPSSEAGYNVGWTRPGEWLEYTVNVATAATYNVDFRVASAGPGGAMHLEVDGGIVGGSVSVPNTGGWQNWQTVGRSVSLPAGQHVLKVSFDANGPTGWAGNLNYLRFGTPSAATQSPFSGTPISIPGTGSATIEAENFDNGPDGVAYHDTEAANLGRAYRNTPVDIQPINDGGYGVGWTKAGEWLTYTVNVATAGSYSFDFRVASLGAGAAIHVEVDSANLSGSIAMPNTGSFGAWQTVTRTGINLPAGQHVVRIAFDANATSGYAGNLNWFKITKV